jgi:hypothetical protein
LAGSDRAHCPLGAPSPTRQSRTSTEDHHSDANVLVVEDDHFTRLIQVVLDPTTPAARRHAFADFFAHDEPDFEGWCERVRARAGGLFPAAVRLVAPPCDIRFHLRSAVGLVVEALPVGWSELNAAPQLRVVQKFGVNLRNIDRAACAARGVEILTLRRVCRACIDVDAHAGSARERGRWIDHT